VEPDLQARETLRTLLDSIEKPREVQSKRSTEIKEESELEAPQDHRRQKTRKARRAVRERAFQLGLDYGTTASKLVLRDLEAPGSRARAFVVRTNTDSDFRISSIVTQFDGSLYFDEEALLKAKRRGATTYHSLKMRAAFPDSFYATATPLPPGLNAKDMATLHVARLIQLGNMAAIQLCSKMNANPRLSFRIGVPIAYIDNSAAKECFMDIAVEAFAIWKSGRPCFSGGIGLNEAKSILEKARRERLNGEDVGEIDQWIYPEAAAALMWAFHSPEVRPGLFAAIDVGGGTTSASFFVIEESICGGGPQKTGMAFYSAITRPPGLDKLDDRLASKRKDISAEALRGHEDQAIRSNPNIAEGILGEIFETHRVAFSRSFSKYKRQSYWESYSRLFVGGGSQIRALQKMFQYRPLVPGTNWKWDVNDVTLSLPEDLLEMDGSIFEGNPAFTLVAYGLSIPDVEIPEISHPSQMKSAPITYNVRNPSVYADDHDLHTSGGCADNEGV
jgi:hypothetical protein